MIMISYTYRDTVDTHTQTPAHRHTDTEYDCHTCYRKCMCNACIYCIAGIKELECDFKDGKDKTIGKCGVKFASGELADKCTRK